MICRVTKHLIYLLLGVMNFSGFLSVYTIELYVKTVYIFISKLRRAFTLAFLKAAILALLVLSAG